MKNSMSRFLPVALILIATAIFLQARTRGEVFPPRQKLASFPQRLAGMEGSDLEIPKVNESCVAIRLCSLVRLTRHQFENGRNTDQEHRIGQREKHLDMHMHDHRVETGTRTSEIGRAHV